jgi:PAS domain S-box-containing protein
MAAAVSVVSVCIIAGLQHVVGYVPMLFLPVIVLVQAQWGLRPAVFSTILCTLGSLLLMAETPSVDMRLHVWANLLLLPGIAASLIYLMETRRRHRQLEEERGIELSMLLESMPEAVFIFNRVGRIIELSRAAETLTAQRRSELLGMQLRSLAGLLQVTSPAGQIDYDSFAVARALRGETIRDEHRVLRHPGGRDSMHTVLSANAMRDAGGSVIGALLVVRDITEITALQGRIADTERHLAIGQMAAGIAHDFNNVLDTISQAAAVMEMHKISPENLPYTRMIQNAVRRGAEIINRVREYIRGGTGEQTAVDLCQVIDEALDLTSPMWREIPDLKIERELQPVGKVRANPADLRRVFTNLIINSIQAMPEGGRITLRCGEQNHHVVASVSDNGRGIPPDVQQRIFLPYFTTKSRGTGLGLSGAQRIMLSLGGTISFVSEPEKGTTFTIGLPKLADEGRKAA